ncbi:MAG: aminomethyl-transferring glycine dehydrogenase subunit GcvPA [Kordiimonadaceae bacterium]|jgi:glycine dehydrogenase subunit 1|nr:aminomethyl-transferring glycine dehydrogenase subunit GcvPA [Kordiimonadaceae bacterium]MBT6036038.1 aminomethyl-transferring glycine dehydrogenase subunit GcvPA [Kordiimonadaceae bacterium]MBT6330302.1 aminomethyl-transferring glycine dehydrogenase subunit GcvPA [Kordiimonadaceae bacterium]
MRYLPLSTDDRAEMLAKICVENINDLFVDVPNHALLKGLVDLPNHMTEMEVEQNFEAYSAKSVAAGSVPFFVGAGAYRHHVPASVDYQIQRGEYLTAYTPYQPEISQGTLQTLYEFQSQVAQITGMDVANASMYDGSTACGEAALMACRVTRKKRIIVSGNLHPHYIDVVKNLTKFTDGVVVDNDPTLNKPENLIDQVDDDTACVIVQNPDFFGNINDFSDLADALHERKKLLVIVNTEVVALGAIKSPGEMGADIVVGEGQSIGNGLNYGGPYVGLFATRQKYVRQMPGRLCGETTDADGKRGFVLTLSTREQHIRREKATSNICTNAGLCTLAFTIHMTLLGEKGYRHLAQLNHAGTVKLKNKLAGIDGLEVLNETFFNEFTVRLSNNAAEVVETLVENDVIAGLPVSRLYPDRPELNNILIIAVTETTSEDDMDILVAELKEVLK